MSLLIAFYLNTMTGDDVQAECTVSHRGYIGIKFIIQIYFTKG